MTLLWRTIFATQGVPGRERKRKQRRPITYLAARPTDAGTMRAGPGTYQGRQPSPKNFFSESIAYQIANPLCGGLRAFLLTRMPTLFTSAPACPHGPRHIQAGPSSEVACSCPAGAARGVAEPPGCAGRHTTWRNRQQGLWYHVSALRGHFPCPYCKQNVARTNGSCLCATTHRARGLCTLRCLELAELGTWVWQDVVRGGTKSTHAYFKARSRGQDLSLDREGMCGYSKPGCVHQQHSSGAGLPICHNWVLTRSSIGFSLVAGDSSHQPASAPAWHCKCGDKRAYRARTSKCLALIVRVPTLTVLQGGHGVDRLYSVWVVWHYGSTRAVRSAGPRHGLSTAFLQVRWALC